MRILAKRIEQVLKEQENIWKTTNEDLLKRVELLSKEKAEKAEEHEMEMAKVIAEVKANATLAVWEANIKVTEDVANAGSWHLVGW